MPAPTGPTPIINSAEIPRADASATPEKRVIPEDSPYKSSVEDILNSPKHYNDKQLATWVLPDKMKTLLGEIEADTKADTYILRSPSEHPGLISETVMTFDDLLMEQIDYAISDSDPANNDPVIKKWDTHMTSKNGLRQSVASILENPKLRGPFVDAVRQRQAEIIRARDGAESESKLSPEQLEKVAKDEGRVAAESTPVVLDLGGASRAAQAMMTGEQQATSPEKHPRRAKIFAPYKAPEIPKSSISQDDFYTAMVSGDDEEFSRIQELKRQEDERNAPLKKEKEDYDRLVNKDTEEYSEDRLRESLAYETDLKAILAKAGHTEISPAMVTALREDADLRYEVGEYFLDKLNTLVRLSPSDFGTRVAADSQKVNAYVEMKGMPTTSSREYAVWLALAKISGMFNYKAERETDDERFDEVSGRISNAQHRNAADQVLFSSPARYY